MEGGIPKHSHFDQVPVLEDVILVTLERGEVTHAVIDGYTRGEGDSWQEKSQISGIL